MDMRICLLDYCNKQVRSGKYCHTHSEWLRRNPDKTIDEYVIRRTPEYHGLSYSSEYKIWHGMKARCTNPKNIHYEDYGGRGITVYPEWMESFEEFYNHIGPRPKGMTIERLDNNKGYIPGNVIWATRQAQVRNRRTNKNSKSGVTGVSWYKREQRWFAELFVDGKKVYSQRFKTFDEAVTARKLAEKKFIT